MSSRIEQVPFPDSSLLVSALNSWAGHRCYVAGLHSGDIGWHQRFSADEGQSGLLAVYADEEIVAVALRDSDSALRLSIRPDHLLNVPLAEALVEYVDGLPDDADAYTDAPVGSAYRSLLVDQGWQLDPDPWVALYRPLTGNGAPSLDDPTDGGLSFPLATDEDIADRVAVQRSAFAGSTFTVERWRSMAGGPAYNARYELLRRNHDGAPVAAATGWFGGTGKCAILEPVGTHADHRGAGHGKAISLAVIAALASDGASGVTVWTPASNSAAIRTYESCGLGRIEVAHAMLRPRVSGDDVRDGHGGVGR
jgi:GNAT superfamily N-acetyltransferase